MKSVRLSPKIEAKLRQAAELADMSESALIRVAIEEKCDAVLGDRLDIRLADIIGAADLGGGVANDTGKAFTEMLQKQHEEEIRRFEAMQAAKVE